MATDPERMDLRKEQQKHLRFIVLPLLSYLYPDAGPYQVMLAALIRFTSEMSKLKLFFTLSVWLYFSQQRGFIFMDIKKLYEKVIQSEEVHDIPLIHILAVLSAVLDAIASGECFYENE